MNNKELKSFSDMLAKKVEAGLLDPGLPKFKNHHHLHGPLPGAVMSWNSFAAAKSNEEIMPAKKKQTKAPHSPAAIHPLTMLEMMPDASKDALARVLGTLERIREMKPESIGSCDFLGFKWFSFNGVYINDAGESRKIQVFDEPITDAQVLEWIANAKKWAEENPK